MAEENKSLTLDQLREFTRDVLLPATKKQLEDYTKDILLPATQRQFIDYTTEVLLPAFDLRVGKIDQRMDKLDQRMDKMTTEIIDIKVKLGNVITKVEFNKFENKIYTDIDGLIAKVDLLISENNIRNGQEKREKEFFAILIKSLRDKNILSDEQMSKIAKLNII
jgi:regulator of replication initiation timing